MAKQKLSRKKNQSIKFPEAIRRLVSDLIEQKLNEEREYLAHKKAAKLERRRIERENIKNGLMCAKKIWQWAQGLRKSNIGKKLISVSHVPSFYSWVCFFDGHIEGLPWRGLGISKDGLCWMRSGCGVTPQVLGSAKNLARIIDPKILKLACEWIDNGKVWECIEKRFDYLKPEVRERRMQDLAKKLNPT